MISPVRIGWLAILMTASAAAQTITIPAQNVPVTIPGQIVIQGSQSVAVPSQSLSLSIPAQTVPIVNTVTPTCGALPAPVTQTAQCPSGTTGSYTQTASYSAVAYPTCAVLGAYSPTTPPAGACPAVTTGGSGGTGTVPSNNCGNVLGAAVIFCDTFDTAAVPVAGTRTGALDQNVWGVSRTTGMSNFGQGQLNDWAATTINMCDGSTPTVTAPNDVVICGGQLREASNDNVPGTFEGGTVTSLAMYPKQPFDFSGRTGTVSFDVSNDTAGSHSSWPEFWMSDLPVPDPFSHFDSWEAMPANGLAVRFAANCDPGQGCLCPNTHNLNTYRWTVDSVAAVRNYALDDTQGYVGFGNPNPYNGSIKFQILDCVIASSGPGNMNHIEIRISQSQIDVYATDAGVTPTITSLRHIATASGMNLGFTRGLIWIEDAHYNADKGDASRPSQRQHTFSWDNIAFDGPFPGRDFTFDAPDSTTPGQNGSVNLAQLALPNSTTIFKVQNLPSLSAIALAANAHVLFNFTNESTDPTSLTVIVNGHSHIVPWPYAETNETSWRTYAVPIPLTDLVAGTNTVQLGATTANAFANVDIQLGAVAGAVAVLPGSVNTYP